MRFVIQSRKKNRYDKNMSFFGVGRQIMLKKALLCLAVCASTNAYADRYTTEDMSYDDVIFYLQESLTDHGLVLSNRNHVSSMLLRTSEAVGADTKIYEHADVLGFCSSELSYAAMNADIENIQFCPYNIYLYQAVGSDEVVVGFRDFPDTPELNAVEDLLRSIINTAIE